jgi:hypothetical protein
LGAVNRYFAGVIASAARRIQRGAVAGVILAAIVVGGHHVTAETLPDPDGAIEDLAELVNAADETIGVSGAEAVEALAESGTTEVAAENAGMDPDELVDELLEDPSLFVTAGAMVGYVERGVEQDELLGSESPITSALSAPAGVDVFNLESRPTSGKVIYLDVDGHVTTDDFWGSADGFGAAFQPNAAPYINPATATPQQRDALYEIWRRVSEDYLPFDVNITTRDPGIEGLRKTWPADQNYGQRMVISPTNWVGAGTLGIALLDVFDESDDYSAFVFTSGLTPRVIAEAVSHEAGHTLGLRHDGTTTGAEYYDGHGDWASIMGRSISPNALITQWSKGEYSFANNGEDDVVEIASYTGYRADDHVGTRLVGATSMTEGIIGAGDVDVFAVDLGSGAATVTLRPALSDGSNLHARVTVRDPAGAALSAAPAVVRNWTSSVAFTVSTPGRYTIEVAPSSWLTPTTGFSTYGSMGAYTLEVSGTAGTGGAPPPQVPTSGFSALSPDRLLDTRSGQGGSLRLPAGGQIALQVSGRGGVPVGATAAVLSVVAVDPSGSGFLTTFPCTPARPTASTVNFVAGQIVANTAIAALSASGQICIYAHAETDVVIDVTGWLGRDAASRFNAVGPIRLMDTRNGQGATRLPAGGTVQVPGVPLGATAVSLNVTSDAASGPGFATVFPCASGRPPTSTVNFVAGDTRPNNTIVGVNGGVCVYSMTSTEIIVDLTGFFGPTGLSYLPTEPQRLLDTRDTAGYLAPASAVSYRPATASLGTFSAVSAAVNLTAVDHLVPGFVTAFDCTSRTTTSALNAVVGQVNANGAIVPLANGLDSCLFTQSGGNLVADLNGWWVR